MPTIRASTRMLARPCAPPGGSAATSDRAAPAAGRRHRLGGSASGHPPAGRPPGAPGVGSEGASHARPGRE
eukprot:10777286-Alexandrium_andersonii.AAC.1